MLRNWLCQADATIEIEPVDPVLVKSGYATLDGADMAPVSTFRNGERVYYLPGTSLKGVLRSHFERIARTLQPGSVCLPYHDPRRNISVPVEAEQESYGCGYRSRDGNDTAAAAYADSCAACRLFGSLKFAGRFSIGDAYPLPDHQPVVESRNGVGIDRFTGRHGAGRAVRPAGAGGWKIHGRHPAGEFRAVATGRPQAAAGRLGGRVDRGRIGPQPGTGPRARRGHVIPPDLSQDGEDGRLACGDRRARGATGAGGLSSPRVGAGTADRAAHGRGAGPAATVRSARRLVATIAGARSGVRGVLAVARRTIRDGICRRRPPQDRCMTNTCLKAADLERREFLDLVGSLDPRSAVTPRRVWLEAADGWAFDWWLGLDHDLNWCCAGRESYAERAGGCLSRSTAGRLFALDGELRWRVIPALGEACWRTTFPRRRRLDRRCAGGLFRPPAGSGAGAGALLPVGAADRGHSRRVDRAAHSAPLPLSGGRRPAPRHGGGGAMARRGWRAPLPASVRPRTRAGNRRCLNAPISGIPTGGCASATAPWSTTRRGITTA